MIEGAQTGFLWRISVAGEKGKVTGEVGNIDFKNLNAVFHAIPIQPENSTLNAREFFDLWYLMNTLHEL